MSWFWTPGKAHSKGFYCPSNSYQEGTLTKESGLAYTDSLSYRSAQQQLKRGFQPVSKKNRQEGDDPINLNHTPSNILIRVRHLNPKQLMGPPQQTLKSNELVNLKIVKKESLVRLTNNTFKQAEEALPDFSTIIQRPSQSLNDLQELTFILYKPISTVYSSILSLFSIDLSDLEKTVQKGYSCKTLPAFSGALIRVCPSSQSSIQKEKETKATVGERESLSGLSNFSRCNIKVGSRPPLPTSCSLLSQEPHSPEGGNKVFRMSDSNCQSEWAPLEQRLASTGDREARKASSEVVSAHELLNFLRGIKNDKLLQALCDDPRFSPLQFEQLCVGDYKLDYVALAKMVTVHIGFYLRHPKGSFILRKVISKVEKVKQKAIRYCRKRFESLVVDKTSSQTLILLCEISHEFLLYSIGVFRVSSRDSDIKTNPQSFEFGLNLFDKITDFNIFNQILPLITEVTCEEQEERVSEFLRKTRPQTNQFFAKWFQIQVQKGVGLELFEDKMSSILVCGLLAQKEQLLFNSFQTLIKAEHGLSIFLKPTFGPFVLLQLAMIESKLTFFCQKIVKQKFNKHESTGRSSQAFPLISAFAISLLVTNRCDSHYQVVENYSNFHQDPNKATAWDYSAKRIPIIKNLIASLL